MVLVTGGTGLVGAHLLFKLVSNGEKVRAIYKKESSISNTRSIFATYTKNYQALFNAIEWTEADITDIPALCEAFVGITNVYHCAGLVSFNPKDFEFLRKTNITGTANIVNLCLSYNIDKLCHVSSIATLAGPTKNKPITEENIWNPEEDNSVYAISKYGAEMEVWRGTQEGLDAVIINPGVILGNGIWDKGTGSLFKKIDKGIRYYTSGSVGLVAVNDVVEIMSQLMKSSIRNERFIIVAENWTYKAFLETIAMSINATAPKKIASSKLLGVIWRVDWLLNTLFGKKRELTKHLARSLSTKKAYTSAKLVKALNYKFRGIEETILEVGIHYQSQS